MVAEVTTALGTVISWIGTVISAIVTGGNDAGAMNALLPMFAIGIAISAILLGIKIIRNIVWGA